MNIKKLTIPLLALTTLAGGILGGYASIAEAQTSVNSAAKGNIMFQRNINNLDGKVVSGKITSISGSTITISGEGKNGGKTYTINASNASVTKAGTAGTIGSLTIGDRILVEGTITDNNVIAAKIFDGFPGKGFGPAPWKGGRGGMGHGVMGTVSAVNGSTITLTGKNGTSYTVNASNAKVQKMVAGSISDIVPGDTIGVQGQVSGNSVTALQIMDDLPLLQKN